MIMISARTLGGNGTALIVFCALLINIGGCDSQTEASENQVTEAEITFNRGAALYYGLGEIEVDKEAACDLFAQASQDGHAKATFNLANCFRNGDNQELDLDRAEELYLISAAFGITDAYISLGIMYLVEFDDATRYFAGNRFLQLGIYSGDTNGLASYHLGVSSLVGRGIDPDPQRSISYFVESASRNNIFAAATLAEIYCSGVPGVPVEMDECKEWRGLYDDIAIVSRTSFPKLAEMHEHLYKKGWLPKRELD